jgi:hypothetical protein
MSQSMSSVTINTPIQAQEGTFRNCRIEAAAQGDTTRRKVATVVSSRILLNAHAAPSARTQPGCSDAAR